MKDGPSITRNVKPGDVQRVHVDVVSVVLHLLQRITGRETGQGDRVAGHHPHLAPVGEAEVLLEVLLMVEDGPDHNFALQLQRHNLEGRQPVLVRDRGHLQVGVTGREELYCRDLGAVDLTVSKGWTPAVTCEGCVGGVGGVASPGQAVVPALDLLVGGQTLPAVPGQHGPLPTAAQENVAHRTDGGHLTAAPEHLTGGLRPGHVPQTNIADLLSSSMDRHQAQRGLGGKLDQRDTPSFQEGNLNTIHSF